MKKLEVKIAKRNMGLHINKLWDDSYYRNKYMITVTRGDKNIRFVFWDSANNTQKGDRPTDYDILVTIKNESYCSETFEDFCDEFGYDNDSIKAKKTFQKLNKMSDKILSVFTPEELEKFPD